MHEILVYRRGRIIPGNSEGNFPESIALATLRTENIPYAIARDNDGLAMTGNEIKRRAESELVVVIDQEMGYKIFLWFPAMTGAELEAWWTSLEDVEAFWRVDPETGLHRNDGWPGDIIEAHITRELNDLWQDLEKVAPYYASIFWNFQVDEKSPDTYLKRRDGAIFLHRAS